MKRILVAMLMVLMSMPSSAWAQICLGPYSGAKFNAKPFNPAVGVKFYIDPNIFAYDPLLYQCVNDGMNLWDHPDTKVKNIQPGGYGTALVDSSNVQIVLVPASDIPGAITGAQGGYLTTKKDAEGYVETGTVYIPNNIVITAGLRDDAEGCNRIKRLVAHELGHGYFGGPQHTPLSVMQGGNTSLPYNGLNEGPLGPTDCDRKNEKLARTYEGAGTNEVADTLESCNTNTFTDSHGCPCGAFYTNISPLWNGLNHKPFGHIEWPKTGFYAPFSGNLIMHASDADGWVNRVDYLLSTNGGPQTLLLTSTTRPHSFFFNAGPGTYSIQPVLYDTANEYTMLAPTEVKVCAAAPPAPTGLSWYRSGSTVQFWWNDPSPGWVQYYQLEAGTYPGGTDAGMWQMVAPSHTVYGVPSGTYYVRVKAYNPCGLGAASYETVVSF